MSRWTNGASEQDTMAEQSFLQSKPWAQFQRSLGRPFFEYDQDFISAVIFKYPLPLGRNYLYVPYGPVLDLTQTLGGIKNPINKFVDFLLNLARKEKAIFIKAEPTIDHVAQLLVENGFKESFKEIQPPKTLIIDLDQDKESILEKMHYKTRYNIKVAEKHSIEVSESNDVEIFWNLIKKTSARDKFSTHPRDYYVKLFNFFKENNEITVKIFIAKHTPVTSKVNGQGGKPIAAAIVLLYKDFGYYLHGASDYGHRNLMAPYKLHWEIIKYLKGKEYKSYDLWGINANKWPGVTRFKLGWGGRVIEYPGSFDLPVSKLWYFIYKNVKKYFNV